MEYRKDKVKINGVVHYRIETKDFVYYLVNGMYHREDNRAAIFYPTGTCYWYKHGQIHRENGPAIQFANGDQRWYKNGKELTEEEFNKEKT